MENLVNYIQPENLPQISILCYLLLIALETTIFHVLPITLATITSMAIIVGLTIVMLVVVISRAAPKTTKRSDEIDKIDGGQSEERGELLEAALNGKTRW